MVTNRGGGIFSFLPVAGAVGQEAFERLWGTPQNVDLEGAHVEQEISTLLVGRVSVCVEVGCLVYCHAWGRRPLSGSGARHKLLTWKVRGEFL